MFGNTMAHFSRALHSERHVGLSEWFAVPEFGEIMRWIAVRATIAHATVPDGYHEQQISLI
jgi:hypothetical protein